MTDSYKRLGAIAVTDILEHQLYSTPSDSSAIISNITVTNRTAESKSFDINVHDLLITEQTATSVTGQTYSDTLLVRSDTGSYTMSTDGLSWTTPDFRSFGITVQPKSMRLDEGKFVGVGYGSIYSVVSTDGITWTLRALPTSSNWKGIAFGNNNTWVATSNTYGTIAASSTNGGVSWTTRTMPSSANWVKAEWGSGASKFVAIGNATTAAASSTDGITWTARTLPSAITSPFLVYNGSVFSVMSGNASNAAAYSTDGITWTTSTLSATGTWVSFANKGSTIVGIKASSTQTTVSTDGITWASGALPSSSGWKAIASTGTLFVAIATSSNIYATSTDGLTWTQRTLPTSQAWTDIVGGSLSVPVYYSSPNKNKLYSTAIIQPYSSEVLEPGILLNKDNTITAKGSSGLTFSTFGVESKVLDKNKILGQISVGMGNDSSLLYQVPVNKQAIIRSINIVNPGTVADIVRVSIGNSSVIDDKDYILYDVNISGKETITIKAGYTMSANDVIYISSGTGLVTFSVYGMEI